MTSARAPTPFPHFLLTSLTAPTLSLVGAQVVQTLKKKWFPAVLEIFRKEAQAE